MVYDWITRGGNDHARLLNYLHTIEAALDQEMIFYPTLAPPGAGYRDTLSCVAGRESSAPFSIRAL
jgi:hypothetical protein